MAPQPCRRSICIPHSPSGPMPHPGLHRRRLVWGIGPRTGSGGCAAGVGRWLRGAAQPVGAPTVQPQYLYPPQPKRTPAPCWIAGEAPGLEHRAPHWQWGLRCGCGALVEGRSAVRWRPNRAGAVFVSPTAQADLCPILDCTGGAWSGASGPALAVGAALQVWGAG